MPGPALVSRRRHTPLPQQRSSGSRPISGPPLSCTSWAGCWVAISPHSAFFSLTTHTPGSLSLPVLSPHPKVLLPRGLPRCRAGAAEGFPRQTFSTQASLDSQTPSLPESIVRDFSLFAGLSSPQPLAAPAFSHTQLPLSSPPCSAGRLLVPELPPEHPTPATSALPHSTKLPPQVHQPLKGMQCRHAKRAFIRKYAQNVQSVLHYLPPPSTHLACTPTPWGPSCHLLPSVQVGVLRWEQVFGRLEPLPHECPPPFIPEGREQQVTVEGN